MGERAPSSIVSKRLTFSLEAGVCVRKTARKKTPAFSSEKPIGSCSEIPAKKHPRWCFFVHQHQETPITTTGTVLVRFPKKSGQAFIIQGAAEMFGARRPLFSFRPLPTRAAHAPKNFGRFVLHARPHSCAQQHSPTGQYPAELRPHTPRHIPISSYPNGSRPYFAYPNGSYPHTSCRPSFPVPNGPPGGKCG